VLVTHDRFLLDRVATQLLALDGTGKGQFFADLAQWEAARKAAPPPAKPTATAKPAPAKPATATAKRLSYLEKREWEAMEEQILVAEEALAAAKAGVDDPAVATDSQKLAERCRELEAAQAEVERLYARWAELEEKQKA